MNLRFFFYLPRCFALIDSSTLEQTREETETEKMTHLESLVELGLSSTFSTILTQCSLDIFKVNTSHVSHSTCFILTSINVYENICQFVSTGGPRKGFQLCNHQHLWDPGIWKNGGRHVQSCVQGESFGRSDSSCIDVLYGVSLSYLHPRCALFFSATLQSHSRCLCHTAVMQ